MHRIDGKTRVYGVMGSPVRHSLSPVMYNPLFDQLGVNAVYVAFEVLPERLESAIAGLRAVNFQGVHLTAPHKEAALPFLDRLSREASAIGAVNVILNNRGMLYGDNTDGRGYLRSIQKEHHWKAEGKTVVLLGAGGAARSIAFALARVEVGSLHILNRTYARAQDLVQSLLSHHPRLSCEAHPLELEAFAALASKADLVIDATTPNTDNLVDALPIDAIPAHAIISDINYHRPHAPLCERAEEAGLAVHRGLGMLVHQGALSMTLLAGLTVKPELLESFIRQGQQRDEQAALAG